LIISWYYNARYRSLNFFTRYFYRNSPKKNASKYFEEYNERHHDIKHRHDILFSLLVVINIDPHLTRHQHKGSKEISERGQVKVDKAKAEYEKEDESRCEKGEAASNSLHLLVPLNLSSLFY